MYCKAYAVHLGIRAICKKVLLKGLYESVLTSDKYMLNDSFLIHGVLTNYTSQNTMYYYFNSLVCLFVCLFVNIIRLGNEQQ